MARASAKPLPPGRFARYDSRMTTFKPGDTVRTRHGDVLKIEDFIDNDEIPMWRCDNGCVYIEPDLEPVAPMEGSNADAAE